MAKGGLPEQFRWYLGCEDQDWLHIPLCHHWLISILYGQGLAIDKGLSGSDTIAIVKDHRVIDSLGTIYDQIQILAMSALERPKGLCRSKGSNIIIIAEPNTGFEGLMKIYLSPIIDFSRPLDINFAIITDYIWLRLRRSEGLCRFKGCSFVIIAKDLVNTS